MRIFQSSPLPIDALEGMIDSGSLADVLADLLTICDAKADHIATNWQPDTAQAKEWQRAYAVLAVAHRKISQLGIPQPRGLDNPQQ